MKQPSAPLTNPSIFTVVNEIVNYSLSHMHTCIPASVEKYNSDKCHVDAKPLINRVMRNGDVLEMPVIVSVPLVWPRCSLGSISFPLSKGDGVLLLFSERSIAEWASQGDIATPADDRIFDMSDAIAIPGLFPLVSLQHSIDPDSLHIQFKDTFIKIKDTGDIEFKNDKGLAILKANGQLDINNGNLTVDI